MHANQLQLEQSIQTIAASIEPTSTEVISWDEARGRILGEVIAADRDNPAIDVSAMDGYALRLCDCKEDPIPIAGTIAAGQAPRSLPEGHAMQVFTGAPVPPEAECVLRREDTEESKATIRIRPSIRSPQFGENIRRQGENCKEGALILEPGTMATPSSMAALATFGYPDLEVYRKVRLVILNTGDEIQSISDPVEPWQIRDSNGPCLEYFLKSLPFVDVVSRVRVRDDLRSTITLLKAWIPEFDAIILTGGVSMGDSDHVPEAIISAGGKIVFHKIPIRPGKPVLGALGPQGQLIMGLPGNPVSVMVTARRILAPLLQKLAGASNWYMPPTAVELINADTKTLPLVWFRLVRLVSPGRAELLPTHGSGDITSLACSDGFVEIPPESSGPGPWPFYGW